MDYFIGIASYKRPKNQRTLAYLEKIGADMRRVILTVQTEEDRDAYTDAGNDKRVGKFIFKQGRNASENRNTILDAVPNGKRILLLDDDITYISKLRGKELVPIRNIDDFNHMVNRGFALAEKYKTSTWGIYPVHNAYFMSNKYRTRNIADATLLAIINTDLRFNPKTDTKEDFEYCCEVIRRYGTCIRMENYACNAQHHSAGGCEEFWKNRKETVKTAKFLVAKYPDILELNSRRPGEVKMARKRS